MSKIKLAIGILSAASAATWAPYLLEKPKPPRPEDDSEVLTPGDWENEDDGITSRPELGPGNQADAPAAHELLQSSRSLLEELRNLVPNERRSRLDTLSTSWGPTTRETHAAQEAPTALPPVVQAPIDPQDVVVRTFLSSHPLSAILYSDGDPLALIGPYVVRPGQELIPGLLLESVEARAVVLQHEGRAIRLTLPPVRSRPPSRDADARDRPDEGEEASSATSTGDGADDLDAEGNDR